MKNKWKPIVIASLAIGLIAGVVVTLFEANPPTQISNPTQQVVEVVRQPIEFSYVSLSYEQMIDQSDLIIVGKVADISSTQWNQESGEPWEDGLSISSGPDNSTPLQIHYIDLEIERRILDMLDTPDRIKVTALGVSPWEGDAAHGLKVGDEGVFFAKSTEIAWRDGKRSVIVLVGDPAQAYLRKLDGGYYRGTLAQTALTLDEVVKTISQRRET